MMQLARRLSRQAWNQIALAGLRFHAWMIQPTSTTPSNRDGKIRYGCALWLLGLPLPIVILALFYRGCDW